MIYSMNLITVEEIQLAAKRLKKAKLLNKADKSLFDRSIGILKNPDGYFNSETVNRTHDLIDVMYLVEFSKIIQNQTLDNR